MTKKKEDKKSDTYIVCECGYEGELENVTGIARCPVCHRQ